MAVRVGILTGGGDCPGLNAVVRAAVHAATSAGAGIVGYRHGWLGLAEGDAVPLSVAATDALLVTGGTALGTARFHPGAHPGAVDRVLATLERDAVDALVVVGGDGTLGATRPLVEAGVPVVGIPKTIDNDVPGTDRSVGFDTGLAIATEAVDRVTTTAESHDRLMVIEVMGRHAGWLAVGAGIAGGAHAILVPERPFDIAAVADALCRRHRVANYSIVVVAEGAVPAPGTDGTAPVPVHDQPIVAGSIGAWVRTELAERSGFESRLVVLGHVQRGGTPTAGDRLLATRFGVAAVRAALAGTTGTMTALVGDAVQLLPLEVAMAGPRGVPDDMLDLSDALAAA